MNWWPMVFFFGKIIILYLLYCGGIIAFTIEINVVDINMKPVDWQFNGCHIIKKFALHFTHFGTH